LNGKKNGRKKSEGGLQNSLEGSGLRLGKEERVDAKGPNQVQRAYQQNPFQSVKGRFQQRREQKGKALGGRRTKKKITIREKGERVKKTEDMGEQHREVG